MGLVLPVETASAQGMFDFFFGNRRSLPPQTHSYADPYGNPGAPGQPHVPEGSRGSTYCVRLCDGRYFPMQNHSGATPTQMCQAFCPAAKTKTFSGSAINQRQRPVRARARAGDLGPDAASRRHHRN
jgi:hypothetical protein